MRETFILCAFVLCGVLAAPPNPDITYNTCGSDITARWPEELRDDQIIWASNEKSDLSGPKFRLISDVDVRFVEPETNYNFVLEQNDESFQMERFIISIDHEEMTDDLAFLSNNSCQDFGQLRSLSDLSEHISYKCTRYLVERSTLDSNVSVPFEWTSPSCGCTEISAEVMETNFRVFTKEDDRFLALRIRACVLPNKVDDKTNEQNKEEILNKIRNWYNEDEADEPDTEDEHLPQAEALIANEDLNEVEKEQDQLLKKGGGKKQEKMKDKKLKRKEKRENRKRKAKKLCCKSGVETRTVTKSTDGCANVPEATMIKAVQSFGLKSHVCSKIFKLCCEDEIVGERKLNKMKKRQQEMKKGGNSKTDKEEKTFKKEKKNKQKDIEDDMTP